MDRWMNGLGMVDWREVGDYDRVGEHLLLLVECSRFLRGYHRIFDETLAASC
jgi:hypothetical protein